MDTPSSPPCIFCGKDRDLAKATCPHCGRGWIDRRLPGSSASWAETTGTVPLITAGTPKPVGAVPSAPPAEKATSKKPQTENPDAKPGDEPAEKSKKRDIAAAAGAGASGASATPATPTDRSSSGEPPDSPTTADVGSADDAEPTSRRALIATGVIAAAVVSFLVIGWIGTRTEDPGTPGALATTTTASTGADTTTTSTPPPTTVAEPTTTTTTVPPIDAEGEAIAISDLSLGAFALGPLTFGTTDALGPLVATFGQPDTLTPAGTDAGLCPADSGVEVSWGPLTAVFTGDVDDAVLVAYRLDEGDTHPASDLATLSGLNLGATVEDLRSVYAGFDVSVDDESGSPRFVVVRGADGVTLLWGPVSSIEDDGIVEGIYSPEPCDGGPTTAP